MCGICGKIDLFGTPVEKALIRRMCDALAPRGPDDSGLFLSDHPDAEVQVGLGHRRLSIIDLSPAAHQPMSNEDGTVWITYNGEIYNYRELRSRLTARGHRFRSDSDTEVVLHLYEEKGPDAVLELNGMFAFALWDSRRRRVWLCRDRIGVKPLVYSWDGATLLFASEIKALLTEPGFRREIDPKALMLYLAFNYVPAPHTIFRGIRKLEPGSSLLLENRRVTIHRYWTPSVTGESSEPLEPGGVQSALVESLSAAVAGCMVADVPVGAFLSGGIDSAAVVAMMARHSARPVHTFTIGVPGEPRYDEADAAQQVAALYGTDHHEFRIGRTELLEAVPAVLAGMDEPFADSSAIPTYIVARETSRHVKVALSGDGGDELFAGYRSYLGEYWRTRYRMIPALVRNAVIRPIVEALPDSRETRAGDTIRQAKKFVRAAGECEDERLLRLREIFPAPVREKLVKAGNGGAGPDPALGWVRALLARVSGDAINRMLCTDLVDSLPGDMLTKVDLMSMRHSLEVRVPLLDHRLVEMALQVPGPLKLRGGVTKRLMRDAFEPLLPPGFARRPKRGFEIPIAEWLRTDLSHLVDRYLCEERIRDQRLLEFETVQDLVTAHRERRTDTSWMLWNLIVFEKWHEAFCGA